MYTKRTVTKISFLKFSIDVHIFFYFYPSNNNFLIKLIT